jgi:CTP:molybdopterin cytidylyltransferase MocA
MPESPALVVFYGGRGASSAERTVDDARLAAALDAAEAALEGGLQRAIFVTDEPDLTVDLPGVEVDFSVDPFHFGRRLADVVRRRQLDSVIYAGAGSVPLFAAADFREIASRLERGVVVTNNSFSSDLVAFPVDERALAAVERVERDNALARAFNEASRTVEELPRTVATQMDIDSPSDLLVLALTGDGGPRLRKHLAGLALDAARYERTLPLFTDRVSQIVVAGRVGSHAWAYLERETACRVRLFAEERGMEADGRAETGAARSLLGFFLDAVGLDRFFETLSELGDAAFIDTRVLLAHKRIAASREDRFLSDLGEADAISEPFLRDFTRSALAATMSVLLGGHSLMSGGLMALNEHAWALSEREA